MRTATPPERDAAPALGEDLAALCALVARSRHLVALTGAGCSTESGIPDYRSPRDTPRRAPMTLQQFKASPAARQRYWARAFLGWPTLRDARPNSGHHALAALEADGPLKTLITQNVDRLHHAAGSREIIELHGALAEIICLDCQAVSPREDLQARHAALNPGWRGATAPSAPDGDADTDTVADFRVAPCARCGGVLKPRVVFFGEQVPPPRVAAAFAAVDAADALLVVGTSLTVYSGLRFVHRAHARGIPIGLINLGPTRADAQIPLRVSAPIGAALPALIAALRDP